ncbi:hypothetical protein ACODNH_21050 (plasmid) [Haloarcula sp. NS06]|uniref:hypothetical protein n=1 Tax=Haloarcula sp. NS06 TaxID=3409688 RepID=UPI003DA6FFF8
MAERQAQTVLRTVAQTLIKSFVVLPTILTGIGSATGRWLASRRTQRQRHRTVASGVAGMLGAMSWTAVTFLTLRGTIEPIGYREGIVHVGVLMASSDAFVLWQEVAISVVLALTAAAFAISGGVISGLVEIHGSTKSYHRDPS